MVKLQFFYINRWINEFHHHIVICYNLVSCCFIQFCFVKISAGRMTLYGHQLLSNCASSSRSCTLTTPDIASSIVPVSTCTLTTPDIASSIVPVSTWTVHISNTSPLPAVLVTVQLQYHCFTCWAIISVTVDLLYCDGKLSRAR